MKIITLHNRVNLAKLCQHIEENLDTMFLQHRNIDLHFAVTHAGDTIEISQPESYEGVLFSIKIKGSELWITRSEHYVDDVNSLTVESILNDLFNDVSGKSGTDLLQEG
jgi:hypothetical protein